MTKESNLAPEHLIKDEAELRAMFPPTHDLAKAKCLNHIDKHARDFINRSPFLCIGTQTSEGRADVSPRGDPRGFVKALDSKTLLIPDRPGNNRLDTLSNILSNSNVGLIFMIPGFDETMRVNGEAKISRDPVLLQQLAVQGSVPSVAIVVAVEEVFIHCAKAFRRAKLWDTEQQQLRNEMPSLMQIVLEQTTGAPISTHDQKWLDGELEEEYRKTMY